MSIKYKDKTYQGIKDFTGEFKEKIKDAIAVPEYAVGDERERSEILTSKLESSPVNLLHAFNSNIEEIKKALVNPKVLLYSEEKSAYKATIDALKMLNINASPTLFSYDPRTYEYMYQACAYGFCGYINVFFSNQFRKENMYSIEEKLFIIGHELGHNQCNHLILSINSRTGYISRLHEYSADRAGLIASKSLKASASALLKIDFAFNNLIDNLKNKTDKKIDWKEYNSGNIGESTEEILNSPNKYVEKLAGTTLENPEFDTHPHTYRRIAALEVFSRSQLYYKLARLEPVEGLLNDGSLNKAMKEIIR